MPGRKIPLVTGEYYHVFNQGNNRQPTFNTDKDYFRALKTIYYYRFFPLPIKLSYFLTQGQDNKEKIIKQLETKHKYLVKILAFCLMPNHFHFLFKQLEDKGISKFMSNFQNSYTRYFNTKYERKGSLFLDQFKAIRVETDEQLLHVCRYIHLNPYSSFVIKNINELKTYKWSSLNEYLGDNKYSICDAKTISDYFIDKEEHLKFIIDQADYQRNLEIIKHLALED